MIVHTAKSKAGDLTFVGLVDRKARRVLSACVKVASVAHIGASPEEAAEFNGPPEAPSGWLHLPVPQSRADECVAALLSASDHHHQQESMK